MKKLSLTGIAVLLFCLAATAGAEDAYRVGTSDDWFAEYEWMYEVPSSNDNAYIDNASTINISDGRVHARRVYLGSTSGASGNIIQTGGHFQPFSGFYVGQGGTGSYSLSNAGTLLSSSIYVGGSGGNGSFNQSGGTVKWADIRLGGSEGTGIYKLSNGELDMDSIQVYSSSSFRQYGGTVHGGSNNKVNIKSGAVYDLHGGTVKSSSQTIEGNFNQIGGTNQSNSLYMSNNGAYIHTSGENTARSLKINGDGRYDLSEGGTLHSTYQKIGEKSNGTMQQEGGTNTVNGSTVIGQQSGSAGTYNMSGGNYHVRQSLTLGEETGSTGTYNISGGSLTVADLRVGYFGSGSFNVNDSASNITVASVPIHSTSTPSSAFDPAPGFTFGHATTHATSTPSGDPAKLLFGFDSAFSAVSGTRINMNNASLDNWNKDQYDLWGFNNVNMAFNGSTITNTLEVAGQDLGSAWSGSGNFAFNTLTIGDTSAADIQLVNHRTNMGGTEALYADSCVLGAGSSLDLNGINLYCNTLTDHGATIKLNGGQLITASGQTPVAPEPISSTLFIVGGVLMGFRVLKKRRKA